MPIDSTPPLTTVDVPPPLAPMFARAQEYVRRYFAEREEDPTRSTISISGERYVLVRAASMSVEFFDLVLSLYRDRPAAEAWGVASNLLFDLAHAIGRADARNLQQKMGVTDPIDRLSAGPVHFAFSGWAFVRILAQSVASPDENFCLHYEHPYSFESDSWLRSGRASTSPVCVMNAGYSSGWCEQSFGIPLVAVEVACRARGDAHCRFIMAPPSRIEAHLAAYFAANGGAGSADGVRVGGGPVAVPEFFQRKRLEEELLAGRQLLEQRVLDRTAELTAAKEAIERQMDERKELEARLLHSQKMESVGRLAGGVAHDFNNHLTAISGYLSLAESLVQPGSELASHLAAVRDATTRASNLTSQLLAFARRQIIEPRIVCLGTLVDGLRRMLGAMLGETVALRIDCGERLWPVRVDPTQIEQVVVNLAVNARDAMPSGGAVAITMDNAVVSGAGPGYAKDVRPGEYVRITVRDTGTGMPPEVLARIFEPFFTTKAPGIGTGLGLAMCYGIVTQSGGTITVESEPGRGTAFHVYLPRAAGPPEPAPPAAPAGRAPRRAVTVLLVEDAPMVRAVTAQLLKQLGYAVIEAEDAAHAIFEYRRRRDEIGAVLSDVVMPGADGRRLAAELRELSPGLPIVLMSGYVPGPEHGEAVPVPYPFLQKPFTTEQLGVRIAEAVRAAPGGP